jgi:hypothetical protein
MSAATMAEGGCISLNLSPTFSTDDIVYARLVFEAIFTNYAGLGIYDVN